MRFQLKKEIVITDDGFELLYYHNILSAKKPKAVLFGIAGSDYWKSVRSKLENLEIFSKLGMLVAMAERRGIQKNGTVDINVACRYLTKQIKIRDNLMILQHLIKKVNFNGPVILAGKSEGADIASVMPTKEPRISHLVLFSAGGGWSFEKELKFLLSKGDSLEEWEEAFEKIKKDPESLEMWDGHPYCWWSSFLWDPAIKYLQQFEIPIFLGHGINDKLLPVESARAVVEKFNILKKTNLTYREYPVDHAFIDDKGRDAFPLLVLDILKWLESLKIISNNKLMFFEHEVKKLYPALF